MKIIFVLVVSFSQFLMACGSPHPRGDDSITTNHERLEAHGEYLSLSTSSSLSAERDLSLRHIATVKPPVVDKLELQATDLHLVGNEAFISYNFAGETQKGAIDVIDISKITNPQMTSSLELIHHDANAIYQYKDEVFVVGAVDTGGAELLRVPYKKNLEGDYKAYALSSFAGTDVVVSKDRIFTTTGDQGGLEVFDLSSMDAESFTAIKDARGVSVSRTDGSVRVVSGQPALVSELSERGEVISETKIHGNWVPESKSTIESGKTTSIVSLGEQGFAILCNDNNEVLSQIAVKGVTNAVSYDDGMVYAANGEAGVEVYFVDREERLSSSKCDKLKISHAGSLRFDPGFSANHVVFKKGYLFVASGAGGFKIIQVSKARGPSEFDDFDDD